VDSSQWTVVSGQCSKFKEQSSKNVSPQAIPSLCFVLYSFCFKSILSTL
jgi:hypothetical protein